ncbi:uncharacterized protein LOC128127795 [Lactuca sativa]|uniref:uncharacterized protein LOC128127795 n=1 Tax=Lactuca sativa TaxID=4236 RepID=UPI0022AF9ACC|nr:uncharacterized protein LOC128127795 [Lactuca sativa]
MPYPNVDSVSSSNNRLIIMELYYDIPILKNEFDRLFAALTNKQQDIFLDIMDVVKDYKGGVFFVYDYGGTGETFLWNTISATIGAQCRKPSLIISDEAPTVHKHAFEVLDRNLKDILRCVNPTNSNIPFVRKVIVFGGDFRQILPVVPGASRQNIVHASLCSSYLWKQCNVHKLTMNKRLTVGSDPSIIEQIRGFENWLLDIGDGNLGGPNDGEEMVDIPEDIVINNPCDPIGSLISFVYPYVLENINITNYLQERAILAPKNEVFQEINDRLLSLFLGEQTEYLCSDSLCRFEFVHDQFDAFLYSPYVFNSLKISSLPNNKLTLKVGVQVLLFRNIDQKNGLCNGTRL